MTWGLPPPWYEFHRKGETPATALWLREIWPAQTDLMQANQRCLILLDSFAMPEGEAGAKTRTWFGYDDRPIFAWAGVWRKGSGNRGFAGVLVSGAPPVSPRNAMPALVRPSEYDLWLTGDFGPASIVGLRSEADPDLYREPTEEPWNANARGAG